MGGIEPDDFDLHAAKHARSSTDEDERHRCPECESIKVRRKPPRYKEHRTYPPDWSCNNCNAHFDEPLDPVSDA